MHLDTKTPKIDFNKQAESTLEDPGLVDYDDGSVLVVDKVGETFEPDADNSNFQDPLYAPDLRLCVEGTQPDGKNVVFLLTVVALSRSFTTMMVLLKESKV